MEINITHTNGAVQSYEFGPGGVFDPDNPEEMMYISAEPDYFGKDWLTSLFPYPFTDVNMWENGAIMSLYDNGFMQGTSETIFSLDSAMTRGMFVTVLGRMAEIAIDDYKTNTFKDVNETDYFSPYIAWAYKAGIVKGNATQNFYPNDPITKEQAVLMLARFAEKQGKEFSAGSAYSGDFEDVIKYLSDFHDTSEEFQQKYQSLFHIVQPSMTRFGYSDALTRREAADILASTYRVLYEE